MAHSLQRRLLASLVLALATLAVLTVAAPARATDIPSGFFGLGGWSYPNDAQAAQLGGSGLRVFRAALSWDVVEPTRGNRNWSDADSLARRAQADGFDILFVLNGCARWACGDPAAPPKSGAALTLYQGFVADAVSRYGATGSAWGGGAHPHVMWQVGNEVNGGHYFGQHPKPAEYAAYLGTINQTIKSVDPTATVVMSGLVEKPGDATGVPLDTFLQGLYATPGFTSAFDVAAVHAYAEDPDGSFRVLDTMRRVMIENNDASRPLWVTEMSWATGGPLHPFKVDEPTQAAYLRTAWDTMLSCRARWNLQKVMWFAYTDFDPSLVGEQDYWGVHNGLLRADGSPKPAWNAFLEYLGSSLPAGRADECSLPGGNDLDISDPDTTITDTPGVTKALTGTSVSFTSNEPAAHFECSMDGVEAWHACTSPWPVPTKREGLHWLRVRAIDDEGNIDPSPARADWMLDLSPPNTTIKTRTPRWTGDQVLKVTFTGKDAVGVAGFQCQLDKGAWTPCASPYTSPQLNDGWHYLNIRSVDKAGWVDPTPLNPSFKIDPRKRAGAGAAAVCAAVPKSKAKKRSAHAAKASPRSCAKAKGKRKPRAKKRRKR